MNPQQTQDDGFDAILKKYNYTPPQQADQPKNWYDQVQAKVAESQPQEDPNMIKIGDVPVLGGVAGGALKTIGSAAKAGYDKIQSAQDGSVAGTKNPLKAGTEIFGGLGEIAASPLASIMKIITDRLGDSVHAKDLMDAITNNPEVQKFAMSQAGQNVTTGAEVANDLASGAGAEVGIAELPHAASVASDAADAVGSKVGGVVDTIKTKVAGAPELNDLQKINETITPKPTVKEARLATEEGRLYKGNEPTLLKSGTSDNVATSEQQANSVRTIEKNIPGAAKMDGPELYQALDEKIVNTSKKLQPRMEATPLKPETVSKVIDDMENLKKTQMAEAKATDEPNVAKRYDAFEKIVTKNIKDEGNLNDIWNASKEYDASIKSNVKNATDLSSEELQVQKDEWLERRAILRSAMTDAENGLGGTAKKAFSDMRDMYEAQNGIMSKAKIETTVKPSKVVQFAKDHPAAVKGGSSLIGAEGLRKAVTGSF